MANMMVILSAVALLVILQASPSLQGDCKKYRIVVNKLAVCPNVASIIVPESIQLELREDCKLYSHGCLSFSAFSTANVSYWGMPNGMKMMNMTRSNINGCAQMTGISLETQAVMHALNVPTSCPVGNGRVCSSASSFVDISNNTKELDRAGLFGKGCYVGRIDTTFNSGRGCIDFNISVINTEKKKFEIPGLSDAMAKLPGGMPKLPVDLSKLPKMPSMPKMPSFG